MNNDDVVPAENKQKAARSLADMLAGKSDEVVAKIVAMCVAYIRPALAEIYMAARSAIELAEDTGEANGGLALDGRGRLVISMFFGAAQFSTVQAMVGEAHASSVLFFVDDLFRQVKKAPGLDKSHEGGKMVGGCKLTKALRTATNFLRHKQTWNNDGYPDEKAMLEAIGVTQDSENPATKILKAIGLGNYMDFEDDLANATAELLLGKQIDVRREWRIGGALAMREKAGETGAKPDADATTAAGPQGD